MFYSSNTRVKHTHVLISDMQLLLSCTTLIQVHLKAKNHLPKDQDTDELGLIFFWKSMKFGDFLRPLAALRRAEG